MLTESRKQSLKNLIYDLNSYLAETDIEELEAIATNIQANLANILEWIDEW